MVKDKKFNTAKLLVLRDNIDRYLRKLEADKYSKATLQKILSGVEKGEQINKDLAGFLKDLKEGITGTVNLYQGGMVETAKALDRLNNTITQGYSSREIVMALNRLEKLLKTPPKEKTKDRTDEIVNAIKGIKLETGEIEFPSSIEVSNFPPQKVPTPVTNININPLRGFIHTTTQTITTSRAKIPSYGELENRRSLVVYNNSSTVTVFLGGTGVVASDGVPLPPKSYSPALDAGPRMILYGITSSSSANIRVMEISNDTGN